MRIAVIAGDGIGVDVTAEAVKIVRAVGEVFGRSIDLEMLPYGADYYLKTGITLPPNGYVMLRDEFDAIYIGALGDPRVPDMRHARDILLGTRFELDLYVNVGGRFKPNTEDEIAVQEEINTYKGVHRIIKYAFEHARATGLTKVCMADKSNAMTAGHALWLRLFHDLSAQYSDIEATHLYIDALAMQMVKNPGQFQVIVTNNMFGDIVTDLGAQLQGGLGLAASGNLHPGRTSMFEPVHGSAPKYAGKNVANPVGAILSAALMLEYLGLKAEAAAVEAAVRQSVVSVNGTAEIGGKLGTRETGDYIANAVRSQRR